MKEGYGQLKGADMSEAIIIRHSNGQDEADLHRLAALDDRRALEGDAVLAFVDDELQAAVSVEDGRALADPFRHTAALVELLRLTVDQEHS